MDAVAYDEELAERVDELLAGEPGYASKRMFGGIAMMLAGNMAVGVLRAGLLVRVPAAEQETLMAQPGTRPFEMGGRQGKGWVVVVPEAVADEDTLAAWVARGVTYARSLPAK